MDPKLHMNFSSSWAKYFPGSELPLAVFYSNEPAASGQNFSSPGDHCMIGFLKKARKGEVVCLGKGSIACGGGNRYCGFSNRLRPNFEYFLSYGTETLEGERYKKDPELVKKWLQNYPPFEAPGSFLIFKRWDLLDPADEPFAVIFFSKPDTLSGLFTLANYDEESDSAVTCPMGAGCMTIIQLPFEENKKNNPVAILGMFDVSARPCVGSNELTFAVPIKKFQKMIQYMDENFLTTESWKKLLQTENR